MKKNYTLVLIALLFLTIKSNAQNPILWQHCYGTPATASIDNGNKVRITTDGGFIVAGKTEYNGGDVVGHHQTGSSSTDDYWVIKTDSNGSIQWTKCLGGYYDEIPFDIRLTLDGGYIVIGFAYSDDNDVVGQHGNTFTKDMWVVKLSSAGIIEWQKSLGGSGNEEGNSIIQLPDSTYIAVGSARSNDGDVSNTLGPIGTSDLWVVKLDAQGNLIWEKSFGGTGEETASQIEQDTDGTIVICGYSNSSNGDLTGNNGLNDAWIIRIDTAGTLLNQKNLGGPGEDLGYVFFGRNSFALGHDGTIVFTCPIQQAGGDISNIIPNPILANDIWVVKLNYGLQIMWENTLGTPADDFPSQTIKLLNGNYGIIGFHNYDTASSNLGSANFCLWEIDTMGNQISSKTYGGPNTDKAFSFVQLPDSNFVMTGYVGEDGGDVSGLHVGFGGGLAPDLWLARTGCSVDVSVNTNGQVISANANGATYQWIDCNNNNIAISGATTQSYTVTSNGDYAVIVSTGFCSDTSSCVLISTVGISEAVNNNSFSILPNPTSGQFTISLPTDKAEITVTNALGQQILKTQAIQKTINLQLDNNGVYIVYVTTKQGITTRKLIVNL